MTQQKDVAVMRLCLVGADRVQLAASSCRPPPDDIFNRTGSRIVDPPSSRRQQRRTNSHVVAAVVRPRLEAHGLHAGLAFSSERIDAGSREWTMRNVLRAVEKTHVFRSSSPLS